MRPEIELLVEPYPFQTNGINWLYGKLGALLADSMGLGKSMQAIIAARLLHRDGLIRQVLILCPKTLLGNWCDEIQKWWPGEKILVCRKDRRGFFLSAFKIKLANYEALTRLPLEVIGSLPSHDLVIIDEAQKIKNSQTSTARAVKALPATRRWALTGTPIENSLSDLASIMGFCVPQDVPHEVMFWRFLPNSPYHTEQRETIVAPLCHSIMVSHPAHARELVNPYMLRRRQEDVLPELPEKFEQDIELDLLPRQRATYNRAEEEGVIQLNELGDELRITHIFQLISKLRQMCNFDPVTGASCKVARLCEDLQEIRATGHKTLVFSQFVGKYGLAQIARYLPSPLMIHGEIGPEDRMAAARRFNTLPSSSELLLNYKCGGLGLNLHGASYVYLFDRWWNPAVEDQAIHRVYRIGQRNKVIARKFVCRDTIEEHILKKLAAKRKIAADVVDSGEPESCSLTEAEIFDLFQLKVRPRRSGRSAGQRDAASTMETTSPVDTVPQPVSPVVAVNRLSMGGFATVR